MKILIACEESQAVTIAFREKGHEAYSCDILDCSGGHPEWHIKADVLTVLNDGWDMMIGHPSCRTMANSGVKWLYHPNDTELPQNTRRRHPLYPDRMHELVKDIDFFLTLCHSDIEKVCLESSQPHGLAMSLVGKYTQKIQPWMFGAPYTKGACLWTRNLKKLVPTHNKSDYETITAKCHFEAPGPDRAINRAKTEPEVAKAFAEQWG